MFNPIEMFWAYQKRQIRSDSTQRTPAQAEASCNQAFARIPHADLSSYFDHVQEEENKFWKMGGLRQELHPPVIIPLYDDDDDTFRDAAPGSREVTGRN
jgi:hypothetical protein